MGELEKIFMWLVLRRHMIKDLPSLTEAKIDTI